MSFSKHDFSELAKLAINDEWDYFPEQVYENLPALIRDACSIFNDKRERDVFLTGALVVLGGCFHNLIAYNSVDRKGISSNLFACVIAPPANGKRALQYSKKLAGKVKQTFNLHSAFTETRKSRRLLIPANVTQAGIIQLLDKNAGIGITVESEIDTLVNANKSDWGKFTDVIRNAFENESYSMYRKTEQTFIEIGRVQLSLALSGTKGQFKSLISSVDDGLFSRGCYYLFDDKEETLKSFGRMNSDVDVEEKFESFATIVDEHYRKAIAFDKLVVAFDNEQMTHIQTALQVVYDIVTGKKERGFEANIKRAFSVVLKIATLLTFLENCEANTVESQFQCSEKALVVAVMMMMVYLMHGSRVYDLLTVRNLTDFNRSEQRLYYVLPEQFTQDEALTLAQDIGIKERSAYNTVKGLRKKGWIVVQPDGTFKKQV